MKCLICGAQMYKPFAFGHYLCRHCHLVGRQDRKIGRVYEDGFTDIEIGFYLIVWDEEEL